MSPECFKMETGELGLSESRSESSSFACKFAAKSLSLPIADLGVFASSNVLGLKAGEAGVEATGKPMGLLSAKAMVNRVYSDNVYEQENSFCLF